MNARLDPYLVAGVHEAAHVCASLDLGYPIDACRIWREQGQVIGEVDGPSGLRYRPRAEAAIALAGPCAESRLTGMALIDLLATCAQKDFERALNALARGTTPCSINLLLPHIDDWLDQSWPRIRLLGSALQVCRELDSEQVLMLLA